jgi:Leucine-rich repeat (LRR) protein
LCCLLLQAVKNTHAQALTHCTESTTEDLVVVYNQTGELLEDLIKRHPKMTSLEATNSKLTKLPDVFSKPQCFLKNLDLSHNYLTELAIYQFFGLDNLRTLSLANNRLTILKDSTFNGLEKVLRLDLSHNHLYQLHFTVFNPLLNMIVLKLDNNQLKTIKLRWFTFTNKLSNLELQCNQIEKIEKFENGLNFSVQELNLTRNHIVDLSFLADCKHLKSLDLSNNINAIITDRTFEHNQQLMYLGLQNVSLNRLGDEYPILFQHSSNLEQLDIGYNHLESIDFQLMPFMNMLRGLNLTGNNLKVFIIGDLAGRCPNLAAIDITGHQLDESTLETLMQYCHDHAINFTPKMSKCRDPKPHIITIVVAGVGLLLIIVCSVVLFIKWHNICTIRRFQRGVELNVFNEVNISTTDNPIDRIDVD